MQTSSDGINLIKSFEGCRLTAYQDIVGIWTIGYGHTGGITPGMTISQQQADEYLANDLGQFERGVAKCVTVPLLQHQFDALVSFSYNLGIGTLMRSSLLSFVNASQFLQAADVFLEYDHAGGKQVAGLTRRRQEERALFLKPPILRLLTRIKGWFRA